MMRRLSVIFFFLVSEIALGDVMNLNNFIPTQLEDASPIDESTWDIQFSTAKLDKKVDEVIHRPNIRYGASKNLQLEAQGTIESGGDEIQSGESEINFLYRFNRSSNLVPEVSLSPMFIFPTGKKMEGLDYGARLNLSSTLRGSSEHPLTQIHFNYLLMHNNSPRDDEVPDRSAFLLGLSHRLLEETALVFDAVLSEDREGVESYLLEGGIHQHLGKKFYLGLSAGAGIGASDTKRILTLALEKQFN